MPSDLPTLICPKLPAPPPSGDALWAFLSAQDCSTTFSRAAGPGPLAPVDSKTFLSTGGSGPRLTTFGAVHTGSKLILSFRCTDDDIWGTYTQRDDPLYEEEVVEAFLCPTGDLRHYYEFEVSPRNVIFDARVFSPDLHRGTMEVDIDWDCRGLETAVYVEGELHTTAPDTRDRRAPGVSWWNVEIAIPFAAFPEVNPPKPGDIWRANFYRIDRSEPPEFTAWSPTLESPPNFHVPERFGYLQFR